VRARFRRPQELAHDLHVIRTMHRVSGPSALRTVGGDQEMLPAGFELGEHVTIHLQGHGILDRIHA
jgi:hypothetical protein